MQSHLIDIEQRAISYMREGNYSAAAELFEEIVAASPDWEHGTAVHSLACCHEELGHLLEAEHCYRKALEIDPASYYFLGGYASFLYLHGDAREAYKTYISLIGAEKGNEALIADCLPALKNLCERIGVSNDELMKDLELLKRKPINGADGAS